VSIDTDREKTNGGRQRRHTVERLTPGAGSVQAGPGSAQNASPEFVDPGPRTKSSILGEPGAKFANATRGRTAFPAWLGRLRYYGLALLLVGAATLLRWALWDVLSPTPFLVFYLAWVAAAAFGGLGPGLLATLASWWCIDFLFDPGPSHVGFHDMASTARLLVFLAGGLVVSAVGEAMRRSRIRERRRTQELAAANAALRESEYHLAQAQQITHLGSWSWDLAADRLYWSDEAYRLYGLQPGESAPRHEDFLGFVHPEDRPRVEQCVQEALARGGSSRLDFRIIQRGGRERYVHCEAEVTLDQEGHPVKAEGALQDITERKRAEEAVAESRKKYRGLVETINDWVWEIDADGVYTYVSPRARELLGYLPEEIVGKTPFDLMPPAEAQRVWNAFEPIWLGRKPLELLENTLVRKDGRLVTVETSGMPVCAEDGTFRGYTGVDRDVTARKQAEESLRESEERYRTLFESSRDGIIFTDVEGRILRSNPYYREMLGYSEEELHALTYQHLTPRRWHEMEAAIVRDKIMSRGYSGEYEKEYVRKDGTVFPISLQVWLIRDAHGEPQGMWGIVRDITERKWAEEMLRRSEEQFHRLFEDDVTADFITTPEGKILLCNPAFARTFGFSRAEDAVGTSIVDLYLDPRERRPLLERLEKEGKIERLEVWRKRRDGEPIYVVENIVGQFDEQGRLYEIRAYLFEDTQRKRAEDALRELNATLESRVAQRTAQLQQRARQLQKLTLELTQAEERERKRLAEILHDDLQQVLAAAKFQVSLLGSRVENEAASREIAEQARDLLGDAIAKSRSLSHELSAPVLSRGDLNEAFEWLAEQMQTKHGFTVHLAMDECIELASEPLRVLLYKAAQELLFNAIKHAGVHEATLRLRHRRGRIWLFVSDQGRGFDSRGLGKASGFGLLSVRERTELLGGRMKIRSTKGKGSTFVLTVPDSDVRESALPREASSAPSGAPATEE
jgi:PAS domain S-box-containing protein